MDREDLVVIGATVHCSRYRESLHRMITTMPQPLQRECPILMDLGDCRRETYQLAPDEKTSQVICFSPEIALVTSCSQLC
jgi:hypothetical protein